MCCRQWLFSHLVNTYFTLQVRNIIGDFAILIAILVNVGIDAAVGLPTPKLTVPSEFKVSRRFLQSEHMPEL